MICGSTKLLRICASLFAVLVLINCTQSSMSTSSDLRNVNFEIFGKVQKVYFRKHTEEKARELGLVGWVMNTPKGSVLGQAQGEASKISLLKHWLRNVGSPKSRIDNAEFSNEVDIENLEYEEFEVRGR